MAGFIKTFDSYHHNFLVIFQLFCKTVAKKAIYNFKVIKDDEGKDSQFLFENVQNEIFEIFQNVQKQHKIP